MKQTFDYGRYSYDYFVEFSDRKTLGLMVRPDLRIIAKAPYGTSLSDIEAFLGRKWKWLNKQLTELKKYQKKHYKREYIAGESFQYLGRQYMLIVESSDRNVVKLERGRLKIFTTKNTGDNQQNKKLINAWYEQRQKTIFQNEYKSALKLFVYTEPPQIKIRNMVRRWGSYRQNTIYLNPKLIKAPREAILYVLVHELCHVTNKKHNEYFHKDLEKRIPKWKEIKEKLEVRYG